MKKFLVLACFALAFTGCVTGSGNESANAALSEPEPVVTTTTKGKKSAKSAKATKQSKQVAPQEQSRLSKKVSDKTEQMTDKAIDKLGEAGEKLMDKMLNKIFSSF